jgi:hypothetical protein
MPRDALTGPRETLDSQRFLQQTVAYQSETQLLAGSKYEALVVWQDRYLGCQLDLIEVSLC